MKIILIIIMSIFCLACNQKAKQNQLLQARIDSLEKRINDSYKPGFGEFMSSIQVHHIKLWFAGKNKNWKLADFEMNEIKESLDGIQKYCTDRQESKSIGMINQPIDNLNKAIQQKDSVSFKNSYILLTNTCNSCHKVTNHEFNVVKIPDTPPFSNQIFKDESAK